MKGKNLLIAAGVVAAIVGANKMILMQSARGVRNHNPGNIRWDGHTEWEGMAGVDNDGFIQFGSPEWGIRAMARILKTKAARGVKTLGGVITEWAPPSDGNDTQAYIEAVAGRLVMLPWEEVSERRYPALIAAIIHHENGIQPYSSRVIQNGIALA